jgi:integrase
MATITKRTVDSLKPGAFVWDRGFGAKATDTGSKIYLLGYRIGRRRRRYTIGEHGRPWTLEGAKKEAGRLLALIATGVDPLAVKAASRAAPTFREVAERFLREHAEAKRRPSTARLYRGLLDRAVLPTLGNHAVTEITRADVAALHHLRRRTPVDANRMVKLLSKIFSMAERWGLRVDGSNPARNIDAFPEESRHRYLSADEFARLGEVMRAATRGPIKIGRKLERLSPTALAAIKLLIFTGCRRGEILSLKWGHVDHEHRELRLPTSKTGYKIVPLNAPALAILTTLPRVEGNEHVLPGLRDGAHLVNVTKTWHMVRALAGLKDVRLHDLRHSLASIGADAGLSLPMIGKLLGHSVPATTARYAHLSQQPVKQASELVGKHIAAALRGGR